MQGIFTNKNENERARQKRVQKSVDIKSIKNVSTETESKIENILTQLNKSKSAYSELTDQYNKLAESNNLLRNSFEQNLKVITELSKVILEYKAYIDAISENIDEMESDISNASMMKSVGHLNKSSEAGLNKLIEEFNVNMKDLGKLSDGLEISTLEDARKAINEINEINKDNNQQPRQKGGGEKKKRNTNSLESGRGRGGGRGKGRGRGRG